MIITSSPLRISLGGGGTDLPSYYREHTGFVISAAINKYVYITLHETFAQEIIVKYSKMEVVQSADEIKHPIVREALKLVGVDHPHLEITSMSDIPAGTGLGSSGSFTTALLRALHCLNRNSVPASELAEQACHIELELLGEPIGKQDQYIAAIGGITCFTFHPDGHVDAEPLRLAPETLHKLEDNLILFFTGFTRNASDILKDQDSRSKQKDAGHDRQSALRQAACEGKQGRARGGRPAPVCRADARALGAQEAAHAGHEQPADRRILRPGPGQRRAGRQVDRRRRRRVPDVLHRRQDAAAAGDDRRRACARCGSASTLRGAR